MVHNQECIKQNNVSWVLLELNQHSKNAHIFVNTFIKILREVSVSSASIMRMVDEVGVEPTLFLMSRIYSPLPSPTGHTHPYNLIGAANRT